MRVELRPLLLFVSAYAINASVHETAHALAAYTLGIPARLFHIYASVDLSSASIHDQAVVRAAGPIASLLFGALCWLGNRAARGKWAELPLFYLAVFGIAMFLGNVLSTATVGDFSNAAVAAGLSVATGRVISSVGWALLAAFAALVGQRLRAFATSEDANRRSAFDVVVLPAILGTAAIIVLYQPMPTSDSLARASEEAVFWLFAALAAHLSSSNAPRSDHPLEVRSGDWALTAAAVTLVRVLALGTPFTP
jgi:hypothetical protein